MSKKLWNYHDARYARLGLMICASCGNTIDSGMYRSRDAGDRFINHHRSCSLNDKKWAEIDSEKIKRIAYLRDRLSAFISFRDKWLTCDLDDEIDSMTNEISEADRLLEGGE